MAENYKIVNSIQLNSELINIANSIRVKSGTVGELNFYNHEFDLKVSSIQTPADGSIPTVIHTEPTIVGTFNTTTGNVEMKAGHHADAGYMGLSGTLYNTANVQIGLATKTTSAVTNSDNSVTGWVNVTAGYTPGFNQQVSGNIPAVTFDNANKISGASFVETTGDYGFRASVQIPSGYYAGGTYTKDFSTGIFPAPESKGTADKMLAGYSLYDQDGKLITGTMPNQGAQFSTLTYEANSYTIPAGYHTGAGIINVPKATRATPSVNSVTFNASNNIISIDANVVQTAGVVNAGTLTGSTTRNVYDLVGTGASTISGTIYTGKPGLSVVNSTGIVTADVASAATSLTPSVTAGYITSGTAGSVIAKSNLNTLQLNIKAGGTTTITSNTKIINAGQFATGDIYATVTAGAIDTPSGSAAQSKPKFTFNASNGVITANVDATSGTAYRNVTTAGYLPTSTTGGTFSMTASSNTYNVGLAAINTPSGVGSASITAGTFAYNATAGNYGLTGSSAISGDAYRNVTSAGYIGTSSTKGSITGTASLGMNVAKTTATTAISGTVARTPVIAVKTVPTGVTNAASGAATTAAPSSGVYVAVQSPANTTTATAIISSVSAGYSDGTNYGKSEGNATAGASASAVTYIPVTSGTIGAPTGSANQSKPTFDFNTTTGVLTASVAATSGMAYRNITKAGWLGVDSTGGTFTMNASSNTYTVTAGAISAADSSITGGSFTPTLTYNSTSGKFDYSGSKSASGTAYANVSTAGYVTSAKNTSKSLSATVSATGNIAKVGTGVDITGTTTKAPTLARTAKPSGDTWTDAASGAVTTTKPTSGVYVQIDAAANTGTLTATPKVTSAGYGTTTSGQYSATAGTATVGAAKATTAYVPIKTGTTSKTDATASASVTKDPTASVSITGDIGTTTKPSGTAGTDYWTLTGSAASGVATASVTASSASVTEGYTTGVSTSTTAKSASTTEKTASATRYIPKATFTKDGASVKSSTAGYIPASVTVGTISNATITSGAGTASATTTVEPGTVSVAKTSDGNASTGTVTTSKPSSGYYVAVKATAAANTTGATSNITGTVAAPSVGTAGYISSSAGTKNTNSVTGTATAKTSAKDSSVTYIPLTTSTLPTSATTTNPGVANKATIGRSTSTQYIKIPAGYNGGDAQYTISAVANGTITASGSKQQSAPTFSKSGDVITASVGATNGTVTPSVTTAGYVSSTEGTKTSGTFTMSASSATYTIPTETKTATANGTVTPTSGKYLSSVTVAIPTYDGSVS